MKVYIFIQLLKLPDILLLGIAVYPVVATVLRY